MEGFLVIYFVILLSIALCLGIYFFIYGNFHKVDANVYRSGQLFCFNLFYLKIFGIKSILNLRKTRRHKNKKWYKDEIEAADKLGIEMHEYPIGDREMISIESMTEIVEIIKNAPKPILLHCKSGADRTSLATALYHYAINHDQDKAYSSLSIIYGHFPWFGSKTAAMDKSLDLFIENKLK